MAGTRKLLAKYLKVIGVENEDVTEIIKYVVNQQGYPSSQTLVDSFVKFGFKCRVHKINEQDLINVDKIFLAPLNGDELNLVMVLHADAGKIIYLNSTGDITKESSEFFCSKWSRYIFVLEVLSVQIMKEQIQELRKDQKIKINTRPSIKDIKLVSELNEPPIYKLSRNVSKYFTYSFVRMGVHPNFVTFLWLLSIVAAGFIFSLGNNRPFGIFGALLICLGYTFDCSDGEVARFTGKFSLLGGYIDSITHWISGPILILGATIGIYKSTHNADILRTGLFCIFGDTLFNYLNGQLNAWRNSDSTYGLFHPILLPLGWVFPINLNIFMIGGLLNRLGRALKVWEYASLTLTLVISVVFLLQEVNYLKKNK